MRLQLRLDQANDLLRSGDLLDLLRKPLYSESTGIGLRLDLRAGFETRLAKIERKIRPATREDIRALVDPASADSSHPQDAADRRRQARIEPRSGTHGCFVADGQDGLPGFMHYLFTSEDNVLFQSHFAHTGPVLGDDEAMVEFLYVTPAARTMSFVIDCMTLVAEEARKRGARSVGDIPRIREPGGDDGQSLRGFSALCRAPVEVPPLPQDDDVSSFDLRRCQRCCSPHPSAGAPSSAVGWPPLSIHPRRPGASRRYPTTAPTCATNGPARASRDGYDLWLRLARLSYLSAPSRLRPRNAKTRS